MAAPRFPHAAVASPHYLASSAGLAVLTSGGNAVDAAVAMNLVLAVVYPHMCGLGGDLFAMVWADGELSGLEAAGRLPASAKLEGDRVPAHGPLSATVPCAVRGWLALVERFGTRTIDDLARPAVRLAREGAPRAPGLAKITALMAPVLERDPEAKRIFLGDGPLIQPELADTIEDIERFYEGPVARNAPPPFAPGDFAEQRAEWVEPLSAPFAGVEVYEMPPSSRGRVAIEALQRLEPLDGLSPDDAEFHRRLIRAFEPAAVPAGDTIYLCARDESGMSVSLNQSVAKAFGACVVVPGTGVLLHNRAVYFTPETYRPRARPVHTLAPAMALRDGEPQLIFGTMGGETQPQIHLQLLARVLVAGQELGEAIAAPRWTLDANGLHAEDSLPDLGADRIPVPDLAGHAHALLVEDDSTLTAAHDPRSDGAAMGY
ncbi:MAG: gamma-glutamyltransferase [Dehalococcoidia bacterium]